MENWQKFIHTIKDHLQHRLHLTIIYVLCGVLGLLCILLMVNEKNWRPLKGKTTWKVMSNYSEAGAPFAIDHDLKTYWTSYVAVTSGMFFQVDIGKSVMLNGILLDTGEKKEGQPVWWVVKVSRDGVSWQTVVPQKQILYRSLLAIIFPAVPARYIQIIHTAPSSNRSRWIISELNLLQPILPWQFERSTLIFWILGCLFAITSILMMRAVLSSSRKTAILTVLLTGVVLLGWFLRVYDIRSYELSDKESQLLSVLNPEEHRHKTWLTSYVEETKTGPSWLMLLFIRWAYQLCSDYVVAMRLVPAIFGTLTILLLFVGWHKLGMKRVSQSSQPHHIVWESVLIAMLVGLSAFPVIASRSSDASVVLLFFGLLYLAVTHRFVSQQRSYGWLWLSILLFCIGFSIDSNIRYVPSGIVLYGSGELCLHCLRSRAYRTQIYSKQRIFRLFLYLTTLVPFYGVWYLIQAGSSDKHVVLSLMAFLQPSFYELTRPFQLCGVTGMALWGVAGISLIGCVRILSAQNHQEWFWYIQGFTLFLITYGFASPKTTFAMLILIFLTFCLFVRGVSAIWVALRNTSGGKSRFFTSQPSLCSQGCIGPTVIVIVLGGYVTLFSWNTLFLGNAAFPYMAAFYKKYHQEQNISALIHHILADQDDCKTVATLEPQFMEIYPLIYTMPNIQMDVVEPEKLQGFAELGYFWTYIFVPPSQIIRDKSTLVSFLDHYYIELGRSVQMALYKLRQEFYGQKQRYTAKVLYRDIGDFIEDPHSSSKIVKIARKKDPKGLLAFGPSFIVCRPGWYIARFVLRSNGDSDDSVAFLEVKANTYRSLVQRELKGKDFPDSTTYYTFDLPFELDAPGAYSFLRQRIEFFVYFPGKSELRLDYLELIPTRITNYER